MAFVRKNTLKKFDIPVKTFNNFAIALTSIINNAAHKWDEINTIFDNCRDDSIQNVEREIRGKSKKFIVLDLISQHQNVLEVLENF